MSEDPKGFDAGDYNLFRYCHNDPIDFADPMGLETELIPGPNHGNSVIEMDQHLSASQAVWQRQMTFSSSYGAIHEALANKLGDAVGQLRANVSKNLAPHDYRNMKVVQGTIVAAAPIEEGASLAVGLARFISRLFHGSEATATGIQKGATLYRAFGGEARALGRSWTTVAPDAVSDFRAAAGLFEGNTGKFVITSRLKSLEGFSVQHSLPGPMTPPGALQIPEVLFAKPPVPGVNIEIIGGGGWHP
jgi:hypothetical protein